MTTLTVAQAAAALRQAGWPETLVPAMVGVGKAESGLRVDATSRPNRNGTIDHGWLQINSVHSQYVVARLLSDPVYTAAAGLAIYKGQGLKAWSTYNNGAYKVGGLPDVGSSSSSTSTSTGAGAAIIPASLAGDAAGSIAGTIGAAVQPLAYRVLALAAAAGLALAGLWRLTQAPRRKAKDLADKATDTAQQVGGPAPAASSGGAAAGDAAASSGAAAAGAGAAAEIPAAALVVL